MGKLSKIDWTDHSYNPWWGCKKVSAGCKFCYAEATMERFLKDDPNPFGLKKTKQWNFPKTITPRMYEEEGRDLVFTCSMSDFFIEGADDWRPEIWEIIRQTPHLNYQILTKRPERIRDHLPDDWGEGWPNVWLGISAENHQLYRERMAHFIDIPAAVKFISFEPLIGPVAPLAGLYEMGIDMERVREIDWLIIGGESGPGARYMSLDWMSKMIKFYQSEGIPVFVKQLGSVLAAHYKMKSPKGNNWDEWPKELRWAKVRQWPVNYRRRANGKPFIL